MAEEKRITIPLRTGWLSEPIHSRADRAVRDLRLGVAKHAKADAVTLSAGVNHALWAHGKKQPPAKLTVLVTVADGVASARLPEEKAAAPEKGKKTEAPKIEKPAATKALVKEPATAAK